MASHGSKFVEGAFAGFKATFTLSLDVFTACVSENIIGVTILPSVLVTSFYVLFSDEKTHVEKFIEFCWAQTLDEAYLQVAENDTIHT